MLGDIHIAEPGAVIGFAGARVIEQTIREKLPEGFQRAEYLKEHGMVDMVVHRLELKDTLVTLCRILMKAPSARACAGSGRAGARAGRRLAREGGVRAGKTASTPSRRPRPRPSAPHRRPASRHAKPPAAEAAYARDSHEPTTRRSHGVLRRKSWRASSRSTPRRSISRSDASSTSSNGWATPRSGCRRRSTWPAPTARARRSPSCARSWRPPASRCTSTPRRTSCASTSASASAGPSGGAFVPEDKLVEVLRDLRDGQRRRADHGVRDHHGGRDQ